MSDLFPDLTFIRNRDVIIHCSYKSVAPIQGGPGGVVDQFIEAVHDGILLFPTYDFDTWPQEHYWNITENPSKMGIITETARLHPEFYRTSHPIESYAVYGDHRRVYNADLQACMGPHSLFDLFIERDGLLISLGGHMPENQGFADENVGFSIIHHSEMMSGACDWRRLKWFGGTYMVGALPAVKSYSMNVRAYPNVRTAVSPAMRQMVADGVVDEVKIGRSISHVGDARPVHDKIMEYTAERPELLRVFE